MTFIINKLTSIFQMKNLRHIVLSENTLFSLFFFPFQFCKCPVKRRDKKQDRKMS